MEQEIVAAQIGSTITNDPLVIRANIDRVTKFLDRQLVQFMAACDLGNRWVEISKGPTLFLIDRQGKPLPPPPGEKP